MEAGIARRNEQGRGDEVRHAGVGAELAELLGGERRRMAVADSIGSSVTWASIPSRPPLTPEMEAERAEFVRRTYGGIDQE